ncbi:hypothetical protein [Sagittula salina]|uniref:Uncharacterized protein n=1 Tax=Sagittula salina TaxID=2820268 RepID=A0A940MLC7_9RHOB|nr:hypothetical protein [Sagittula salina]MBP0483940.1 hypothetical protein [Sagittula salina]
MALRIATSRTFTTTAHFVDGQSAKVVFRMLPDDEIDRVQGEGLQAMLRATVAHIDVEGEGGTLVEFDAEVLDQVIGNAADALSLSRAYNEAIITGKLGN